MKRLLLSFIVCVIVNAASAQTKAVKYYSKSGVKEVPAIEAYFFEEEERNSSGGGTRTRYHIADSSKVRLFNYSNLNGGLYGYGILDGPLIEWHKNGKIARKAEYKNNKLSGISRTWYESGQLEYYSIYNDGLLEDTLKGYYENGKIRRLELYRNGKMVEGKLFDNSGNRIQYVPITIMPTFPSGESGMISFIKANLKYPETAKKDKVIGLVLVRFIVKDNGKIDDIEVIKTVDKDLENEAIRVIKLMPAWNPGMIEGKPESIPYTVPIRFSL